MDRCQKMKSQIRKWYFLTVQKEERGILRRWSGVKEEKQQRCSDSFLAVMERLHQHSSLSCHAFLTSFQGLQSKAEGVYVGGPHIRCHVRILHLKLWKFSTENVVLLRLLIFFQQFWKVMAEKNEDYLKSFVAFFCIIFVI